MSDDFTIDTKNDTITVAGITYDVNRSTHIQTGADTLTLMLDGEPVFDGIEGTLGYNDDGHPDNNPRTWGNVGTMFVEYDRYILGDEDAPDPRDQKMTCPRCEGDGSDPDRVGLWDRHGKMITAGTEEAMINERSIMHPHFAGHLGPVDCTRCRGNGEIAIDIAEYLRREHGARVILPLFIYEHSGITMSCGSPVGQETTDADFDRRNRYPMDSAGWDTSSVGVIFDTPEQVKQCIGDDATDEQIKNALEKEVEIYASYLEGDVTEWHVEDEESNFNEGCCGYVGDSDHGKSECFEALASAVEARIAEMREREEMAARDIETV